MKPAGDDVNCLSNKGSSSDEGPSVEGVEAAAYTLATDAPEADGTLEWDETTLVVVHARSGTTTGLGYTYGAPETAAYIRGHLAPVATGRSVWDVPGANEAMARAVRNDGRPGLVACAISAVDIALWDLKARVLGLPLVRLLGQARARVPVYGSGGFTTYDDGQQDRQLRRWVEGQSIPRVKIKIGESWGSAEGRDRERIARARASIGDTAELYVDANGGYTVKQAVRVASWLGDHGVTWFEEPVSSDDLEGLARIRSVIDVDVAAGEYGYTLAYFGQMLRAGAVDCLQADATRCGGLTVWLRAAALAEAFGLHISGHCAPHAHAAAAASVPNLRHLEWFHDHVRLESRWFDGTLDPEGGHITPGADGAPGHGLTLRAADAEPHRTG
ncbi:enolase C-terminal domain-like protein [Streptomyces violascens]|uniref:enolase C-terminal domain-like protein n=1 Tax=Streptomyces violascens TaxID=67381 RepID=UPI003695C6D1